jgi:hypothetical protein
MIMMNVSGIRYLLIFTFCALTLSGCEDPEVSMGSLGKKFQAPSLTGTSPFDQDMKTTGYVRFQGSCDPRVLDLYLSLDETQWFQVPATPVYTNTTLTGTEVNDASCETDGHFDFYLTKTDLTGWGFAADVDVDALYLRGTTIIGETHVLKIQDNSPGNGNGGPTGVASQVILEKTWPLGFAGSSQCEYFNASVRDANNYFVTTTANVLFSLDKKVDSTLYRKISGYASLADCVADANVTTDFIIPTGKSSALVYYKFPDAPLNGIISFRASDVTLATTTSAYVDVTLRDSTAGTFWMTSYSPYKIGKNMCTKGNYEARYYNGTTKSLYAASAWVPSVAGTNASKLLFYSDANCATQVTAISGMSGNNTYYFKYVGAETDTSNLSLVLSHTVNTATFGTYDDIPQKIEIDRSGNTTLASFDFYTPDVQSRGICNQTQLQTYNSQGTLVTPNNVLISFASSTVSGGALFYATQGDCDNGSNPITSLTVADPQTALYFKSLSAPASSQTFAFSSTGLPVVTRSFLISNKATTVTARFDGLLQFIYPSANVCTNLKIDAVLGDTTHDGTTYINNFNESKYVSVSIPSGYTLYTDATCITPSGGNSMGFVVGAGAVTSGQFNFYIKADSTPVAGVFSVIQQTGGATGYLMGTSPGLVVGP